MMEVWVDLKTLQWAYAHSSQYNVPGEWDGKIGSGMEKAFRFKMAKRQDGISGCITRYRPNTPRGNAIDPDEDKQILVDFEDEQAHAWFLLRWS